MLFSWPSGHVFQCFMRRELMIAHHIYNHMNEPHMITWIAHHIYNHMNEPCKITRINHPMITMSPPLISKVSKLIYDHKNEPSLWLQWVLQWSQEWANLFMITRMSKLNSLHWWFWQISCKTFALCPCHLPCIPSLSW